MKNLTLLTIALTMTAGCGGPTKAPAADPAPPAISASASEIPNLTMQKERLAAGASPGVFYVRNDSKKYDIRLRSDTGYVLKASKGGGQDAAVSGYGFDKFWQHQFAIDTSTPDVSAYGCYPRSGIKLCPTPKNICADCEINAGSDCWYVVVSDPPCRK